MDIRHTDLALLHSEMEGPVRALADDLALAYQTGQAEFLFEVFETYRSLDRQARLLAKGTTKAPPGKSAHNFGLACDFVPFISQADATALGVKHGWYWPSATHSDWNLLGDLASTHGLIQPISWDRPHIEHPNWKMIIKRW